MEARKPPFLQLLLLRRKVPAVRLQIHKATFDTALYRFYTHPPHSRFYCQTRTCRGEAPPSCCARPFGRLKAPLGLSLLRFAAQTRTTLFLLCTKSYIIWRKIGVWRSFRWKFAKEKSPKLLGTSRSFMLCYLKIGNLLLNRLHRGDVARFGSVFVQQNPTASTKSGDFGGNNPTSSDTVHESCTRFWSRPHFRGF